MSKEIAHLQDYLANTADQETFFIVIYYSAQSPNDLSTRHKTLPHISRLTHMKKY